MVLVPDQLLLEYLFPHAVVLELVVRRLVDVLRWIYVVPEYVEVHPDHEKQQEQDVPVADHVAKRHQEWNYGAVDLEPVVYIHRCRNKPQS